MGLSQEDIAKIREAVGAAVDDKIGPLFIDRERHFKEHEWVKDEITFRGNIKITAQKTLVRTGIGGALFLIILGIIHWGKIVITGK